VGHECLAKGGVAFLPVTRLELAEVGLGLALVHAGKTAGFDPKVISIGHCGIASPQPFYEELRVSTLIQSLHRPRSANHPADRSSSAESRKGLTVLAENPIDRRAG
jgi:hypothetical protein